MHELSIAISILDIAVEEGERRDARVRAIHLRIGPLSGVVRQALDLAFELAREDSVLPDCRLVVEEVPLTIFCPDCDAERYAESVQSLRCRVCGALAEEVVHGQELELCALELEVPV